MDIQNIINIIAIVLSPIIAVIITRYLSIKLNHLMSAGRVLIPIVKMIYDRDMSIKNFKPQKYIQLD